MTNPRQVLVQPGLFDDIQSGPTAEVEVEAAEFSASEGVSTHKDSLGDQSGTDSATVEAGPRNVANPELPGGQMTVVPQPDPDSAAGPQTGEEPSPAPEHEDIEGFVGGLMAGPRQVFFAALGEKLTALVAAKNVAAAKELISRSTDVGLSFGGSNDKAYQKWRSFCGKALARLEDPAFVGVEDPDENGSDDQPGERRRRD